MYCYLRFLFLCMLFGATTTALNLNITAVGAHDGKSTLECWQLDTPFTPSSRSGNVGAATLQLGDLSNASYTVLPAGFDGGIHNAPYNQYLFVASGLAHITLLNDTAGDGGAFIAGGEFGLIFAADTAAVSKTGHRTVFPGTTETVSIQIPTKDGRIPEHTLLHMGPCRTNEVSGLRGLASKEPDGSESHGK